MKRIVLLITLAVAAVLAAWLLGPRAAGASPLWEPLAWSPISPVSGCEGIEDPMQYAECCLQNHPVDWYELCPDSAIPDPVRESPIFGSPIERPQPAPERPKPLAQAHGDDHHHEAGAPAHGEYTPPTCEVRADGLTWCVWEGVEYVPLRY